MMNLRIRLNYIIIVIAVALLGMGSRVFADVLPLFISKHFGDALWASMIYFGVRALLINKPRYWAFGISMLFSFCIEFSQLYQADWINELRTTLLGSLVLGRGFLAVDLIRYSIGIVLSLGIDNYFSNFSRQRRLD